MGAPARDWRACQTDLLFADLRHSRIHRREHPVRRPATFLAPSFPAAIYPANVSGQLPR
jgi:hypothetical protein